VQAVHPADALRAQLAALERKYRTLMEIHRALAAWDDARAAALDHALAEEFPGALRELQTLPLDVLEARAGALAAAVAGASPDPWMLWMSDYHALLRAALRIKRRLRRHAPLDDAAAEALAAEVASTTPNTTRAQGPAVAPVPLIDRAFVQAVAHPPGGRMNQIVFERLALLHGTPAETIAAALFTRRRRSPAPGGT
jgi:hypothetical protein